MNRPYSSAKYLTNLIFLNCLVMGYFLHSFQFLKLSKNLIQFFTRHLSNILMNTIVPIDISVTNCISIGYTDSVNKHPICIIRQLIMQYWPTLLGLFNKFWEQLLNFTWIHLNSHSFFVRLFYPSVSRIHVHFPHVSQHEYIIKRETLVSSTTSVDILPDLALLNYYVR